MRDVGPGVPPASTEFEVTADGDVIYKEGVDTDFGRKGEGMLDEDLINQGKNIHQFKRIETLVDRDLFSKFERGKNVLANLRSQWFGVGMSPDERDYNRRKKALFSPVAQVFNTYRKEITGAAAALQELERLEKDFINSKQSFEDFSDTLQALQDTYLHNLEYTYRMYKARREPHKNPTTGKYEDPNWDQSAASGEGDGDGGSAGDMAQQQAWFDEAMADAGSPEEKEWITRQFEATKKSMGVQ